jgi:hypothetical protein
MQYMAAIHTCIIIAAQAAGPVPGPGSEQADGCIAVGVTRPQQAVQRLPARTLPDPAILTL